MLHLDCPILVNKALTGSNIEGLLSKQAKAFVNDSKRNKISATKAEVSNLFEWYAEDFEGLKNFLEQIFQYEKINEGVKPSILAYDWSLNE